MDFSQFFHDSWNALLTAVIGLVSYLHLGQNKKIASVEAGKVDKIFYKKDQELLESEVENKLDRIEIHLRLLCEKNGIHYHEKK